MRLYEKLFGRVLRSEFEDGSDLGGDRGDSFTPTDDKAPEPEKVVEEEKVESAADEDAEDEDEGEEEPTRDDKGRFAKKDDNTKKDEPRIPKARFDEAVNKERERVAALERQLAELQAAQAQVKKQEDTAKLDAEIDDLEKQRAKLLLDGEAEKAAEIASVIRAKERQLAIEESRSMSAQAKEQAREEIRMELTVEKIEAEYPALNPEADEFDEDLVELVLSKQRTLMQKENLSPSKALAKAATSVMGRFGAKAEEPEQKGLKKDVEDRKQAQVKKNIETAKKQPASMKESGLDSDKMGDKAIDIANMSFEEFEALPEATRAKLRGDFA